MREATIEKLNLTWSINLPTKACPDVTTCITKLGNSTYLLRLTDILTPRKLRQIKKTGTRNRRPHRLGTDDKLMTLKQYAFAEDVTQWWTTTGQERHSRATIDSGSYRN